MITAAPEPYDQMLVATNLRRLMAKFGITFDDVCTASGLDERTVRGISQGRTRSQAKTLGKLAAGLSVEVDELFAPISEMPHLRFDRATNRIVEEVRERNPEIFEAWRDADWIELRSKVGVGGGLATEAAVLASVAEINRKRDLQRKAEIVCCTSDGELLASFVQLLFDRIIVKPCRRAQRA